jgi:D-glycero-D-manno-heptose 1,7-bisphosphate phosphatase
MPPAVFLDRDDTLIACRAVAPDGDLGDPALVRLMPGSLEACRRLKAAGFRLVVTSNQGGVARGAYGVDAVERVNARVNDLLGGLIDAFRYCPFHPLGTVPEFAREHPWRKPRPGMILDAASALGIDLSTSWTIGDAPRDVEAGRAAGTRTILIASATRGFVEDSSASATRGQADFFASGLFAAAEIILRESRR